MFSNKANGQTQGQAIRMTDAPVKSVPSIISIDLSLHGDLSSNGEIQVDGTVNGDITCKALIVGTKGAVSGEVSAQTVRIHGVIKGQVKAKSVFLASTAKMSGDIEHESLAIEPGAFMEGHCKRTGAEVKAKVEEPKPEIKVEEPKPEIKVEEPKPEIKVEEPKPETRVEKAAKRVAAVAVKRKRRSQKIQRNAGPQAAE